MYMKAFLIILKGRFSKKYPSVVVDFYLLRESNFVRKGLDVPLQKINLSSEMISFIELLLNGTK